MTQSYMTTPLEFNRKENSPINMNNSDPSESSTGESQCQYKEDIFVNKEENINYDKKTKKKGNNKNLLNKKVNRLNFQSPIKKSKNNIINVIFDEFRSDKILFKKYPQFNQIEKNIKNDFYSSPPELARDIRYIFSTLFSSSMAKLDSEKYSQLLTLSQIFDNIFEKYDQNSQIKTAIKLSDELARVKKEITRLTRKRNSKIGDSGKEINLEEKNDKSSDNIREDIRNKIKKLNSEQKKGILNIISDNLINKKCGNNSVEFDISKFPLNQLKKLDIYINNCINSNHINNNINKQTEEKEEKEKNLMQVEELAPSELSDSDYTESLEFE